MTASPYTRWFEMAARLHIDRAHGPAPHKPLLLLAVADLAEQGTLPTILPLTPELAFRFLSFWTVVAARRPQRPDIRLPFYHMVSDDLWTPLDAAGNPTTDRRHVPAVRLDPGFHACLLDPIARVELRRVLIACYFEPDERAALYDLVGLPVPAADMVKEDAARYIVSRQCGRETRFRLTVVPAYNYTCALTGYRLTTIDAGSMVEAAHIHEFYDSQNNDPTNGLALCRNAHWAFDEGLWSLTDTCHVLVAPHRFDEAGPDAFHLKTMAGRPIYRPANPALHPDPRYLAWHRREHGFET
jgi:putative restriction endonuclease